MDGELVDVISNMGLVRAFGMTFREQKRFGATVKAEMVARQQSLLYLEKLRLLHAVDHRAAVGRAARLGAVAVGPGQGDLGRHRARQLARLHDPARHARSGGRARRCHAARGAARGSRAARCSSRTACRDRDGATELVPQGGRVDFEGVTFAYPRRRPILDTSICISSRASASG